MSGYWITARIEYTNVDGWSGARELPGFLLPDATSEVSACKVARNILTLDGLVLTLPGLVKYEIHVAATSVDSGNLCSVWKMLDKRFATHPTSPLHHDNRYEACR